MVAVTTNYRLQQPTVNADADVWGGILNLSIAGIDVLLAAITTGGSANAYTLTTGQTLLAYATGQAFRFKANFTNSGAATINVDGIGAKALTKNGAAALASGDLVSGQVYAIAYDGTQFQVFAGLGASALGAQLSDATLTALAALAWSSGNQFPYFTAADTLSLGTVSANGLTLLGHTFAQMLTDLGFTANAVTLIGHTFAQMLADIAALPLAGGTLTGDVVLANVAPSSIYSAGTAGAPLGNGNALMTGNYTLVAADAGHSIVHNSGSAHQLTIPANASVAFPIGTVILFDNAYGGANGVLTIAITTDTLRRADGTAGTGSRTVTVSGAGGLRKTQATEWSIIGTGLG